MSDPIRGLRRRTRLDFEPLEGRSLLSAAGTLDSTFGGGYGYSTASLGVDSSNFSITPVSVVTRPDGEIVVTGHLNTDTTGGGVAVAVFNANGTPETSFGTNGVALVALPVYETSSVATVVQANGQIVVASGSNFSNGGPNDFYAIRLNTDGSVDTTYGTDGVASYPASSTTPTADRLVAIGAAVLQSNGDIVLVGAADSDNYAAVRLDTTGTIDTTYGTDGTADVPVHYNGFIDNIVTGATIQSDGQIVVTGSSVYDFIMGGIVAFPVSRTGVVFRLSTTGELDTTFGGSTAAGIVLLPPVAGDTSLTSSGINTSTGIAIDTTDGNILISSYDQTPSASNSGNPLPPSGPRLYELNTDGTSDTSFGTNGTVTPIIYGGATVQSNGNIVLAGGGFVTQLNSDGTPDTSFGNTSTPGLFQTPALGPSLIMGLYTLDGLYEASSVAIQPTTGDILVAGKQFVPSSTGQMLGLSSVAVLPTANDNPVATAPPPLPPVSLTAQGLTDVAVYNSSTSTFYYTLASAASNYPNIVNLGTAGAGQTIPAIANYQGLAQDQIGLYLTASGYYAVQGSNGQSVLYEPFGTPGAGQTIPVPADYYGTGVDDVAVYLTASGTFAIQDPTGQTAGEEIPFGPAGVGQSIPAPADYYGTGQADIAVYLAQSGVFAVQDPTGKTSGEMVQFGMPGLGNSIPVPGDYDGSGHIELAVYVPSLGGYFYRPYGTNGSNDVFVPIGTPNSGEIPVPGDYDGSGHTEVAIYDPAKAFFEYAPANGGPDVTVYFGSAGGGSQPLAEPVGSLPAFSGTGSGSGSMDKAIAAAFVPVGSKAPASTAAITLSQRSSLPAGPSSTLASARVTLSLVNQAEDDSSVLTP